MHETGPAGYPWEVVRSSWTGPQEELPPGDAYNHRFKAGAQYKVMHPSCALQYC